MYEQGKPMRIIFGAWEPGADRGSTGLFFDPCGTEGICMTHNL